MGDMSDLTPDVHSAPPAVNATEPQTADDAYAAHRLDMERAAWRDRMLKLMPAQPQKPADSPAGGAPADVPMQQPGSEGRTVTGTAIVRDVAKGAMEAPRAVAAGVTAAAREVSEAADSLGVWLDEATGHDVAPEGDIPGRPFSALAKAIPEIDDPSSATGGLIKGVVQFLAGFAGAGKLLKKLGGAGKAPVAAEAAGKGAAADALAFDPDDGNLANLLKEHAILNDPVTAFLATDPADAEAVNRLKNAVTGLIPGELAEGLVRSLRFVRARRAAKAAEAAADPMQAMKDQYGEADFRDVLTIGDPNAPLLSKAEYRPRARPADDPAAKLGQAFDRVDREIGALTAEDIATIGKAPAEGENQVFINFARIDGPEDVKGVMSALADGFKAGIDEGRRGVIADSELKSMADSLGMTVGDLLARRQGQAFSPEETLAARAMWVGSARAVQTAARAVQAGETPARLWAFRKALAVHYAVQAEVLGARAEAGRALRAWSIPVGADAGGGVTLARNVQNLLDQMGGPEVSGELARRVASLGGDGIDDVAAIARKGAFARTMGAVKEAYVMGLLWSPTTHIVNTLSNTAVIAQLMLERQAAAGISALTGGDTAGGEAAAMAFGWITSLKEAFVASGRALRDGDGGPGIPGKIDIGDVRTGAGERAISADAFDIANTPMGRIVDFVGAVNGIPGRALGAEDAFFRTAGYRAEVWAQAARVAASEGRQGTAYVNRIREIAANPPENIRLEAADAALYATFTSKSGPVIAKLNAMRAIDEVTIAGKSVPIFNPAFLIVPFLRTPANILKYTFERTPLAPLSARFRADMAAGGARADAAMAKMATGSALMMLSMDYATAGYVSGAGPDDAGEREALVRQGWQPYSVFHDGVWHSYKRSDPIGMTMGLAADMAEMYQRYEIAPDDVDEVNEIIGGMIAASAQNLAEKSYLQGIGRIFAVMSDPDRYTGDYVNDLVGSLVPATTALGAIARATGDDAARDVNTPWEAIMARLPGLREKLARRKDLWGEDVVPDAVYGRSFDQLSPVYARAAKDSPIDAEFERLGFYPRRIQKRTSIAGVPVNFRDFPQAYERLQELAGHALKHPVYGVGAREYLDGLVTGEGRHVGAQLHAIYRQLPPARQEAMIRQTIREYRDMAAAEVLRDPEFAGFAEAWRQRKADNEERSRLPAAPAGGGVAPLPPVPRGGPASNLPTIP